jgi:hypothetical protein
MEAGSELGSWRDLFLMFGTSAAALIGLLFVATSLHLNEMTANPVYRTRSRNLTLHFVAMLVQAAAILTPQPLRFLGIEVIVINLCGMCLPLTFVYRAFVRNRASGRQGGFSIYMGANYILGYGLGIAGGVALSKSLSWGLYLIAVSNVEFFVSVIWNAWKLMLGIRESE